MPRIRPARPADVVLLPALEAASDTLLAARPEIRGELLTALPAPASVRELSASRHLLVAGNPPAGFARLEEVDAPFYRTCGFEVIEPEGGLARLRRHEARLGLDRVGERVAMRIRFDASR